jgi:hypothetical protein
LGKEWQWLNQGNGRGDNLGGSVAAISRKVTSREPLSGFDTFHPFKIYQLPYEFRSTHSSNDWQKFRVRTGYVEVVNRSANSGQRTLYATVTGQGMDLVYPQDADIYSAFWPSPLAPTVNETLDVLLDPIIYDEGGFSQLFVFYIQLSSDPSVKPTAQLKVTNINGDTSQWGLGGVDPNNFLLENFGGTAGFDRNQIPIGAVQIVSQGYGKVPLGYHPTGIGNGAYQITQIRRDNIFRFPDGQMRFVTPHTGSGIEWDSSLQYIDGDVVTVTSGGSASTWLALAPLPSIGATPAATDWAKIADFTP